MPFEGTGNDQVSATGAAPAMQENGSQHLGGRTEIQKNCMQRISGHANMEFFPIKLRGSYLLPRRVFLQLKLPESFSFDQLSNIFMREFWFLEVQPTN